MAGTDWDAGTYDRISDPQLRWGLAVLQRLPLNGDERVLDAGCGSGRVTEALAERLPNGHVIALDRSPAMVAEAARRLARFGERVTYVEADLAAPLPVAEPVDAIFSTATFHWVADHAALFRHLAAISRPGARLVAQCGGAGNIATLEGALRELGVWQRAAATFATPLETIARLEAAGFRDPEVWLTDEPTTFEAGEPFETFLETVPLREVLAPMPPADRRPFVRAVAARLGEPVLDYVRLNILATRR